MKDSIYHDYKIGEYVYTPDGQLRKITRVTSLSIILENLGNIGIHTKTFPLLKLSGYSRIFRKLQEYKEHIESEGLTVYAIALKGSQNYNLSDDESDIDANVVFIPTLDQLRRNYKTKFTFDTGEVTCHNIYAFASIVAKGNPQWVEVCNTPYVIGDLSYFTKHKVNPSALKGMVMEKVEAFSKLYPSREKYVKEFGYDPKQLHHIIRLYDSLANNDPIYQYFGKDRDNMLDIKRGRYPDNVADAEALRDLYVDKISKIYEAKKLAYKEQEVDYKYIDSIVMEHYMKGLNEKTN